MLTPRIVRVLEDPTVSFALKKTLRAALDRDPVDVLNEAELLAELLRERWEIIVGAHRP